MPRNNVHCGIDLCRYPGFIIPHVPRVLSYTTIVYYPLPGHTGPMLTNGSKFALEFWIAPLWGHYKSITEIFQDFELDRLHIEKLSWDNYKYYNIAFIWEFPLNGKALVS